MRGNGTYNRRERKDKTAAQALSSLMWLCSRSEKSSGDALRLMAGWGVPEGEREGVLAKLQESRFIDDRRFAQCYVRDKMSLTGWGPYKITRGLAAKGVPKEIITEVCENLNDEGGDGERLYTLLEKKMARTKHSDEYDLKGKLVRYAAGQGYPYEEVAGTVERLIKEKYNG